MFLMYLEEWCSHRFLLEATVLVLMVLDVRNRQECWI